VGSLCEACVGRARVTGTDPRSAAGSRVSPVAGLHRVRSVDGGRVRR
jgi:hypothetical protein